MPAASCNNGTLSVLALTAARLSFKGSFLISDLFAKWARSGQGMVPRGNTDGLLVARWKAVSELSDGFA